MDNKKKYIRKGQEVTFFAKLKKGDGSLTSWIVYEGNQYDDDHIVKEEKQAGTEFTFTFEKVGEYTIISYGKREEIKKKTKCIDNKSSISSKTNNEGKEEILVNELDSNCAFRLEVIENTIVSIDCVENKIRNAVRRSTDNWELKKGTSVTFKANFYIEKPTEEELSSLKMFVLDSNKNILVAQEGNNNISFIPENDNGTYTISAEHITSSGDKVTKEIIGKCILNNVISIKPDKPGELFRPNEEIIFKVDRMKFSADLEDTSRTKWYLNRILKQEGGETFKFSSDKKGVYFVEATNLEPNSSAKPDEKDTWKLTITDNEVKSISIKGMPKVGRPFELKAKTTFPDLTLEEMQKIKWYIPFNYKEKLGGSNINPRNKTPHFHNTQRIKDPRTIKITPSGAGTFKVSCRINSEFVEENIEIVQPKISSPHWIDKDGSSGNILEKAGYYQEMYAYAKHIGLDEEEVILEVYDVTNKQKPIYTSEKVVVPKGSKEICIPYTIKKTYKGKTEEEKKKEDLERKDIQIFFKIKAADTNFLIVSPNKEFENNLLTITNRGNVVEAYFCDKKDFNKVPIAVCGYRLYFKIYATNLLKREVEVHFCTKKAIKDDFSNSFVWRNWKELEEKFNKEYFFDVKKGVINERGELLVEVDTTKLKKFAPISAIAIIKIINKDGNELGAYKDLDDTLKLYNDSVLERLPQNYSSVKVGYFEIKEVKRVQLEEEGHSCPRCTAPVTVAQLRELFPKAEENTLKTVADTYTKYMKELQMDTCWNKAHFFAQAAIETGFKLDIKSGEGFNYYWEDLIEKFRAFQTTEGRKKAKEWGRAERNSKINGKTNPKYQSVSLENKKKIANWAYSPSSKTGKELGNIYDNDGWTFRGKGLIQLTGRSAYQYANTYTKKENADIIANPDLVMTDIAIGVISSMAFFKWKKINILANGNRNTKSICKEVGNDVDTTDPNGKPSKNHAEKIIFFNNSSSKVFKIDECLWGKESDLKGIMPPWMKVAWEEYEKYKGKHNKQSPLKERICDYFNNSNYKAGTNETSWCAAFVTWCLNKSSPSYEEPKGDGDVKARAFTPKGKYKEYYWEKAKVTNDNKPAYGAIAMIRWDTTGTEHVAFVIGKTKTGRIALLGGNQSIKENGVKIGSGITKSSAKESEIKFYMYPDNFLENSKLYNLTEEDITEKLTHTDTHL